MSISIDVMRLGHSYRLTNQGEVFDFIFLGFTEDNEMHLKDIHTLEKYKYSDLVRFGKSRDYFLEEI